MAKKIVIASGKGGVGKSTVTAGICCAIKSENKSVLAIDFDIGLRSLDLLFGVRESVANHWGDVILGLCESEKAVITAPNGVDVIPAPLYMKEEFTPEAVKKMVELYNDKYDFIFIDAPAGISKGFSLACAAAESAIVVSTADDVCVRSVGITAEAISEYGIEDIRLIINKFVKKFSLKKKFLNVDDVIDNTSVQLIGVIPYDNEIAFSSMNGIGINLKGRSQKSLVRISKRILGGNIELKIK